MNFLDSVGLQMEFRDQLNAISPSFCLAKWLQVTLHLESGTTHSCHHPDAHKIPLRELKQGVAALHNTLFKKEQRRQMLAGQRPKECGYCWNVEDASPHSVSDRILKSSEEWAKPHLEDIVNTPVNENVLPTYLELSFSHACNFKCSYCNMGISSSWENEIKKFGPYATNIGSSRHTAIPEESNPYVTAFWQWWPELQSNLHTLRITGGEPLLSPNTFRLLEELNKNPAPKLHLAINSNLGMSSKIVERFTERMQRLLQDGCIKSFTMYTSLEAWGQRAEYIRNGLDFELFLRNLRYTLTELPESQTVLMSTYNALCAIDYRNFLREFLNFRSEFSSVERKLGLVLDISYLRHPRCQSATVLGAGAAAPAREALQFMKDNEWVPGLHSGFVAHEIAKFARVAAFLDVPLPEEQLRAYRYEFINFFTEHDRRRQVRMLDIFPELKEFWDHCGKQ
jgi:DNA-binding Lrp family transcriptional regulator